MKNNKRVIPIILILALFLVVPVFAWSSNLETDLKVYFPLDNGTDYKGVHNLTGNATFTSGKINNSANFDINFYQYLEDGSANDSANDMNFGSADFSINFWIQPNGTRTNDRVLAFTSQALGGDGWFFTLDNNQVYFFQGAGEVNLYTGETGIGTSQSISGSDFTMITVVKNISTTSIYVNSMKNKSVSSYDLVNVTNGNLTLGMATGEYPSNTFDGLLDEVGIWGKALNSPEIIELYNGGLGINPQTNYTSPLPPAQAPIITNLFPSAVLTQFLNTTITFSWRIDKKNRDIVNSSLYIYNLSGYSDRYTATDFIYTNLTGGDTGNTNHTFVYVNHTFTASQNYTFFIDAINTAGNKSFATNKTINVSLYIPPFVILKSPLDLEIFNISNITFNYNISGSKSIKNTTLFIYNLSGEFSRNFRTGGLGSNSVVFWNITLYSGNFTWFADVYDIGNVRNVSSNRTFQIVLPQENIFAPIITLKTPENNSLLNESLAQFNYNITDTNLTNSTLYLYNSTNFINSYFTTYTEAEVYINETLSDENYTWFVTASNLANNITQSENWTFQRFTPYVVPPSPIFPPIIILKSPLNTAQLNYTSITFNYNISDTNVTNSTLYLYDGLGFVNSYLNLYTEAEIYINETLPNQNYSWFVIGSNSANNISTSGNSTFQIYTTAIIVPIPPQMTGGIIYEVLATSGAGIGIFFQILANALPLLLFGLAIVGIIVIIGHSIIKPLIKAGKL
jgi:hypothetical protein